MYVPTWLKDVLINLKCPKCTTKFKDKNIIAVGIKEKEDKQGEFILFFTHRCNKCNHQVLMEAQDMDLDELAFSVLRDIDNLTSSDKSKIGDHEVQYLSNLLRDSDSFKDTLDKLGFCEEEIEEYQDDDK